MREAALLSEISETEECAVDFSGAKPGFCGIYLLKSAII